MSPKRNQAAIDLTEFRQGWYIVILSVVGVAISINAALLYGFGVLVIPFEEAFGWSAAHFRLRSHSCSAGRCSGFSWWGGSTCASGFVA